MLRSFGFGLGLETFANFLRVSVSVSENLVSEKKSRYRFQKIWYWKKSLGIGFGKLGIGKKSRYRFRKIWYRKKSLGIGFGKFGIGKKVSVSVSKNLVSEKKVSVSVSENLVSEKKSRYRFRSKFWYRHSVLVGQVPGAR